MIQATYLIYCVFWLSLTIGGCGYAVFVLDHSGGWFFLAVFLASCGLKPYEWHRLITGIKPEEN